MILFKVSDRKLDIHVFFSIYLKKVETVFDLLLRLSSNTSASAKRTKSLSFFRINSSTWKNAIHKHRSVSGSFFLQKHLQKSNISMLVSFSNKVVGNLG